MYRTIIIPLLFMIFSCMGTGSAEKIPETKDIVKTPEDIYKISSAWVDSVYQILSPDERISQLFWLSIESADNTGLFDRYLKQVNELKPGGIILFGMSPVRALEVIKTMQQQSRIPLLVSIDGENGPAMRLKGLIAFPNAMTLGAIQDDSLIYELGIEIARQCRLLGIHVNLAPVADVNSNPANPVIGTRSFGENPDNVSRKSTAYAKGLQYGGVMAVGKHFPGHGDTDTDSHKTLPYLNHSRERLEKVELYPFQSLINEGIWGIMSAHLEVPALENRKGIPSSFSSFILKNELRKNMGFRGLIITDAVNMKGAKIMGTPGVVDALALAAGNDIVEFTENLPEAINQVKMLIESGILTWKDIEEKCRRTLSFKYFLTKDNNMVSGSDSVYEKINTIEANKLNARLYQNSVTILKNTENLFPVKPNSGVKTAVVVLGEVPELITAIKSGADFPVYELSLSSRAHFEKVLLSVKDFDRYIIVIGDSKWGRLAENSQGKNKIMELALKKESVVIFLGNAYHLNRWNKFKDAPGLVIQYQNCTEAQKAIYKVVFEGKKANGRLPVSIGNLFSEGDGYNLGN